MSFVPTHIVSQNVAAMYAEPDSGTELVSQTVMGSPVRVLETHERFVRIEGEDRYQGWVLSRWLAEPTDTSDYRKTTVATLICDVHTSPSHDSPLRTKLTAGVPVVIGRQAEVGEYVPLLLPTGETAYTHRVHLTSTYQPEEKLDLATIPASARRSVIHGLIEGIGETARRFVGTPYLWGGTTPFGIDCSGFVQLVYRLNGLLLLRDAHIQRDDKRFMPIEEGKTMDDAALAPGDLLFFGRRNASDPPKITHVGMALGDGTFIHSAGSGRGNVITSCADPEFAPSYIDARRISHLAGTLLPSRSPDADLSIDSA